MFRYFLINYHILDLIPVLILTGWLGSGKSHAARLVASAFPVQANVHTLGRKSILKRLCLKKL